jgi:hypothetical protein
MGSAVEIQGMTEANRRTIQALVRANAGLLVISEGSALLATACRAQSTFLVAMVVVPWLIQLYLLVDTAYLKLGVSRISPG